MKKRKNPIIARTIISEDTQKLRLDLVGYVRLAFFIVAY